MPQGNKMDLTVTTNTGGNNYKIVTFMTQEGVDAEAFGVDEIAAFTGVNEFDEEIITRIKRAEIQGYMLAPYHQRVQTVPAQAPPNLMGRRQ